MFPASRSLGAGASYGRRVLATISLGCLLGTGGLASADEPTPGQKALDAFRVVQATVARYQDAVAVAREARPPDPAKHAAARDLRVKALVAFRLARTELAAAGMAGLDKGGLGEETVKAVTEMLEGQKDVYQSSTASLPAGPRAPPPPPLPEAPPVETSGQTSFVGPLEIILAALVEAEREFQGAYTYFTMNRTTQAAGEAVGVPNVVSASNEWGYKSELAIHTTMHSREHLATFLAWWKEGRATGVPALLYAYRVFEFLPRWRVQWEVLRQAMEDVVDACVDAVRATRDWLASASPLRDRLRAESERRATVVVERIAFAGKVVVAELPRYDPETLENVWLGVDLESPDLPPVQAPPTPALADLVARVKAMFVETARRHAAAGRLLYERERELRQAVREKRPTAAVDRERLLELARRRADYNWLAVIDIGDAASLLRQVDGGLRYAAALPGDAERFRAVAETLPSGNAKESLLAVAKDLSSRAPEVRARAEATLRRAEWQIGIAERALATYLLEDR